MELALLLLNKILPFASILKIGLGFSFGNDARFLISSISLNRSVTSLITHMI